MEKIITFSVAAYNIEQYIDKLMNSFINSSVMEEIEIIIVNDGSKDKTSEIAQNYVNKYPETVKLINKDNGGHGSTINCGIEEAKGKYFKAIDGDDWVDTNALNFLVNKLNTIDADVVLTDYKKCFFDGSEEKFSFSKLADGHIYIFSEIALEVGWMKYHNTIFKTSILQQNNIRLDEHCFYVDTEFMAFVVPYINSVAYFNQYLYCYRLGRDGQSVTPQSRIAHIENSYRVAMVLLDFFDKNKKLLHQDKRDYLLNGIRGHCVWHIDSLLFCKPCRAVKQQLIDFDKCVKNYSEKLYYDIEKNQGKISIIKLLRMTKYLAYYTCSYYKRIKQFGHF